RHMSGSDGLAFGVDGVAEMPLPTANGWLAGNPKDYDRTHAIDVPQLFQFLRATQLETLKKLGIADYKDSKDINRQKFLARLSNEIGKRGVIDVLRKEIGRSTRLNSSHLGISYAVFCLKKKKKEITK